MNFLYKFFAIIYKTYDDKGLDIPHFRAIVTIVFCLFLHLVQLALVFDLPANVIMPFGSMAGKTLRWVLAAIYFTTPILLITIAFPQKKLDAVPVSDNEISKARKIIPVYLFLAMLLLGVLLVRHGVRKGTIHF